MKLLRNHANNREGAAVQFHPFANHLGIGAEAPPPERLPNYHHRIAAGLLIFVGHKGAAKYRFDAQQLKRKTGSGLFTQFGPGSFFRKTRAGSNNL
jgi:hypothetical protein